MNLKLKHKPFLPLALAVIVTVLALIFQAGCQKNSPAPNIVLIVLDTMRADHWPIYGYKNNTAPFISSLASKSVVFENAWSPVSWTAPATTSIFTGVYPFQHGVLTGFMVSKRIKMELNRIPESLETLPEMLKKNGYKTFGAADNINIGPEIGFTRGFDRFKRFKYKHIKDERSMEKQVIAWSQEIKAAKKSFLYIHFNDAHKPYHKRKPWYKRIPGYMPNQKAKYDSEIGYVDEKIKRLYHQLNWDKNTLLIIVADHGEEFGDHGKQGHGHSLYNELVRVPMLIQFPPGQQKHKRIKARVSNMDVKPFIRRYLGIKTERSQTGIDLMKVIQGKAPGREYFFPHLVNHFTRNQKTVLKSVIYKDWKYIFQLAADGTISDRQLYNLSSDWAEKDNLYESHPELLKQLLSRLLKFEKKSRRFISQTVNMKLDQKKKDELKSLGYVR